MKKIIFRIKTVLLGLVVLLSTASCNSCQKFDSHKWKQKGVDWWMTDVREKMVEDLIQSDTLLGMTKEEIVALLGQPKKEDETGLKYLIREKYGTDIDPEYISNLRIELDENGQAVNSEIEK